MSGRLANAMTQASAIEKVRSTAYCDFSTVIVQGDAGTVPVAASQELCLGMAPRTGSRHSFALGVPDELGRRFLSEREPYRFKEHTDTRIHVVAQGDTLEGLAGRYFAPLPRACGFWWVLADFQPDPIVDPTLELDVGRRLLVPSLRVLTDVILSEQRRRFDA